MEIKLEASGYLHFMKSVKSLLFLDIDCFGSCLSFGSFMGSLRLKRRLRWFVKGKFPRRIRLLG